jgi:chromosome partitioning protein
MRRIAILNQKGGVGKTTTAVNLSAALARLGRRVCLIDLDPQAHATTHLGVELSEAQASVYDLLTDGRPLSDAVVKVNEQLTLVGADLRLAAAEVELANIPGRELILVDAIESHDSTYDYVIMDCAPSLGVLTLNALAAASEVFIPLQPHFLALHGLGKLLETTAIVARRINPKLVVSGIVICMYETTTRLTHEVISNVESYLAKSRGKNVPWANAQLFATRIRRNVKLAECPSFGQAIFDYAPNCAGAQDYQSLAQEVDGIRLAAAA